MLKRKIIFSALKDRFGVRPDINSLYTLEYNVFSLVKAAADTMLNVRKNRHFLAQTKDDKTIVTIADLIIESIVNDWIYKITPEKNTGIISEEGFDHIIKQKNSEIILETTRKILNKNKYSWIIDNLDGTRGYSSGVETSFCTATLLLENLQPRCAVINAPVYDLDGTRQTILEANKEEVFLNKKPVKQQRSNIYTKKASIILHKELSRNVQYPDNFDKKIKRKFSGAFYEDYQKRPRSAIIRAAEIIFGNSFNTYITPGDHLWDILPAAFIVKQFGWKATYLDGSEVFPLDQKKIFIDNLYNPLLPGIILAPPEIHKEILNLSN